MITKFTLMNNCYATSSNIKYYGRFCMILISSLCFNTLNFLAFKAALRLKKVNDIKLKFAIYDNNVTLLTYLT